MTFQYLFAYSRYNSVHLQGKKYSLLNVKKTNQCQYIFRGSQKDVVTSTIDLHVTYMYDANVITAVRKKNLRLVHDKRKTEVRFLRASHVASGIPLYVTPTTDTSSSILLTFHSQSLQYDFYRYDRPRELRQVKL